MDHLVIPDPHCRPGICNDRMEWAGRLAADRQPGTIVCLGDLFDLPSLSSYDKGRRSFEGRRYRLDIEAGRDGLNRFEKPIREYNEQCKKNKKAQYRPKKIMLTGNHEQRLDRCVNLHSELYGTLTHTDFGFEEFGWEVIPYLRPIQFDGVLYSHYFVSGVKGESISGQNIAAALTAKNAMSCTAGHNHTYDWSIKSTPTGRTLMGLVAGCYLAKEQHEEYADATEFLWFRGLSYKHNVVEGAYDLETFSIDRVRELYG